jgi:deazaflavin-dependent oxidoreductase (nitroreductase family)
MDSDHQPTTDPTSAPATPSAPQARTLAFQGAANRVVRGVLRTPLLSRLAGARLITIYVVGRKTGRHFAVPVAYTRHNESLLVGTSFAWARNLRTGDPVDVRLKGRRRTADVTVVTDEAGVVADCAVIARGNRQFAGFNNITLDESGEPNTADLHRCWAAGARTLRLVPR